MERKPVIKFQDKFTDTIWLCQSIPGRAYEHSLWPVAIIFKNQQYLGCLIILFSLEHQQWCKVFIVVPFCRPFKCHLCCDLFTVSNILSVTQNYHDVVPNADILSKSDS